MIIDERKIKVKDIYEGYFNDDEEGVTGYDDLLNIRPKYQREFVYKDAQRDEVIRTVLHGFPLNIFYWSKTDDDTFEMLDGQQRTLSLCEYLDGNFSVDGFLFSNLPADKRQAIEDYELTIYICDGTESEKLDWFKVINIAGEKLTDQELRNAVYAGSWTSDVKRYFSKSGCPAYQIAADYLTGSSIRQEYLQTVISWIADRDNTTIEGYMAQHQHDKNAKEIWTYFRDVIEWVQKTFPTVRSQMKGLPWGVWYNQHGQRKDLDPKKLEAKIQELLADDDVTKSKGIYEYLLTGDETKLQIRGFEKRDRQKAFEAQGHKCAICGKVFKFEEMHADHIIPWSKGGKTIPENCQMLCATCNLKKGAQ